jgi:hypothetical protein
LATGHSSVVSDSSIVRLSPVEFADVLTTLTGRESSGLVSDFFIIVMTTQQIADRLVALCREAKWEAAQRELYADTAVSIEPYATPAFEKETKGLAAIVEKGHKFSAMIEKLHSLSVSDPVVAGTSFACTMRMEVTMKGQGGMNMTELCVYDVKDGKIVSEQFHV